MASGSSDFDNPGAADMAGTTRRPVRPRDAASLILWRETRRGPEVLMGRRHPRLRFMPDVLVFPGGRVDRGDARAPAGSELRPEVAAALNRVGGRARAIAMAAVRELREETALSLGPPEAPDLACLDYLCRAVTPPDRPIRFNARFLIAPAEAAQGRIASSGELAELGFYTPAEAQAARMASITALILAEFLRWHALPPAERAGRQPVRFLGMNRRYPER
ncbi:MAG: NUDIX hydrolase [Rhodovarius sp.]|nr:NUDIX hydrolase [Rhodovarius sp.]